jgi:hypothetical protein
VPIEKQITKKLAVPLHSLWQKVLSCLAHKAVLKVWYSTSHFQPQILYSVLYPTLLQQQSQLQKEPDTPMAHLWNSLATAQQIEDRNTDNGLPAELQDSIRYYTSRLTQAAGILLRLPQGITAQAVVILQRFFVAENFMKYEFSVCYLISYILRDASMVYS